ncbi:Class E sortase OS=Streptomyces fumanus OX=67302 GN=GCM10018772_12270 PE=4 SV=1 [Streptomyces fumanus]
MAATTDTDHEEHTAAPGSAPPDRPRRRGRIAAAVSVLGELLITAGLVLGLFVVYSLWWTNVVADRHADRRGDEVRDTWAQDPPGRAGPGR